MDETNEFMSYEVIQGCFCWCESVVHFVVLLRSDDRDKMRGKD